MSRAIFVMQTSIGLGQKCAVVTFLTMYRTCGYMKYLPQYVVVNFCFYMYMPTSNMHCQPITGINLFVQTYHWHKLICSNGYKHQNLIPRSIKRKLTSFNSNTFLSISSRLGGASARARIALGSPRSNTLTCRINLSSGQRWKQGRKIIWWCHLWASSWENLFYAICEQ